jgi:YbbR domain-containing protein
MIRLFRSLIANLATLTTAVLLAIVIWAAAVRAGDPAVLQTIQIPVTIIGQPPSTLLQNRGHEVVQVVLEGRDSAFAELSPEDFRALVDLSDVPFGESDVEIEIEFSHPFVTIISKFPERSTVRLEQIVTREIPIRPDLRGDVARGHVRGEPFVEPDVIRVTGPASRVDQLLEGRITIFLSNERQDVVVTRRPTFYDVQGNVTGASGLTLSHDEVVVSLPVIELAGFAEKPITPDWEGLPAEGYRLLNVTVQPKSILVTGPPAVLDRLRVLRTQPIDINGLTQSFTQQVALVLPNGITLDEPESIIVTVEIEPILTSAVITKQPELRALGRDLAAVIEPQGVRVFLFGPLPVLDSLQDDDVRVTLDLLNLGVGIHNVTPIVDVFANDVEVRSFQPPVVTVIITQPITATEETTPTLSLMLTWPLTAKPTNNPASQSGVTATAVVCPVAFWSRRIFMTAWGSVL